MTMTATSNGNGARQPLNLTTTPLLILPDEKEQWIDFGKKGKSFAAAAKLILDSAKEDGDRNDLGIARLDSWAFGPAPDGTAALATIPAPGRDRQLIPLRNHAFQQLCERAGAPSQYIRKLPGKLQMACINLGMQRDAKQNGNMLRCAGGQGRALLSDRYAPLDNYLVIEVMEKTLGAAGMLADACVRSIAVGPTCSMRLTFPEHALVVKGSPRVGDIVEIGFDLLNGELGNRSVSLTAVAYSLVCLNGMRHADRSASTRLSHIGDPKRLAEAFRDAVPATIAASQGLHARMEKAVDRMIDDVLGEFSALQAFGLSATDSRDVARDVFADRSLSLPEKSDEWADVFASVGDVSAYDVLNGITHVAQRRDTDRRLEMEESASRYLHNRTRN